MGMKLAISLRNLLICLHDHHLTSTSIAKFQSKLLTILLLGLLCKTLVSGSSFLTEALGNGRVAHALSIARKLVPEATR